MHEAPRPLPAEAVRDLAGIARALLAVAADEARAARGSELVGEVVGLTDAAEPAVRAAMRRVVG